MLPEFKAKHDSTQLLYYNSNPNLVNRLREECATRRPPDHHEQLYAGILGCQGGSQQKVVCVLLPACAQAKMPLLAAPRIMGVNPSQGNLRDAGLGEEATSGFGRTSRAPSPELGRACCESVEVAERSVPRINNYEASREDGADHYPDLIAALPRRAGHGGIVLLSSRNFRQMTSD